MAWVLGIIILLVLIGFVYAICYQLQQIAMRAGQELLIATELGDIERMQALLSRRVDINTRNTQGWTSLHVAAAGGDVAVVGLLLKHGADVNAQSYVASTPLDHAVTYSQSRSVVALLQAHGAEGNTSWDSLF